VGIPAPHRPNTGALPDHNRFLTSGRHSARHASTPIDPAHRGHRAARRLRRSQAVGTAARRGLAEQRRTHDGRSADHTAKGTGEQGTRLRLDSTEQEQAKLLEEYRECLFQHGVKEKPNDPNRIAPAGAAKRNLDESGEPKSAYVACAAKKPLPPVELDENANPNFAAQWEDNVRCLRAHGLKVHTTEPGSWTYDSSDTPVPDNEEQLEHDCLREAFSGKKK